MSKQKQSGLIPPFPNQFIIVPIIDDNTTNYVLHRVEKGDDKYIYVKEFDLLEQNPPLLRKSWKDIKCIYRPVKKANKLIHTKKK
jgi:hypothetical protein